MLDARSTIFQKCRTPEQRLNILTQVQLGSVESVTSAAIGYDKERIARRTQELLTVLRTL